MKKKLMINVFIKTVFLAGCIHLVVLAWSSIVRGSYEELNFFNFLDVQNIFPESTKGPGMFVLSYVFFFGLFVVVYWILNKKQKD